MKKELFEAILHETEFTTARSGGPGGQNVNKVNSKVILKWNIVRSVAIDESIRERLLTKVANKLTNDGDLIIADQHSRSQLDNKEAAISKFKTLLTKALIIPKKRKATKPSKASKRKRVDEKKRLGEKKSWRKKIT